jgi:RNA polymerase sigma-70 factor (ECF subfamily)
MDELQRIRDFRASEPRPSETARNVARSALAEAISRESSVSDARSRLRLPRFRVLAIAAAATAAAVILLSVFGWSGSPAGPSPAAAAVLHRLARLIAAQPLTPRPGQYLYVESRSNYPSVTGLSLRGRNVCETVAVDHREIWIGTDGSGLIRETTGPERFSSPADQAACLQANPKMQLGEGGTSNDWFAPQCLELGPTNDWNSLSSDPHVLLQQMRQIDGGPTTPGEDFVHIGDFLRETDAPPAVRATLYQAAALIPGIQLLGAVRDHDGRPGLGIAYPSQGPNASTGSSSELIFDPQTGELLGEQGTGPEYWAVYLSEKVVNGLPGTPPAPLTPPCVNSGGTVKTVPGGSVMTGAGLDSTATPANP